MPELIDHVDHVGSLLRPKALQAEHVKWLQSGEPEMPSRLRRMGDVAVAATIGRLAQLGLPPTDGESRRTSYLDLSRLVNGNAFSMTDGYDLTWRNEKRREVPEMADIKAPLVVGRLRLTGNHMLKDEGAYVLETASLLETDVRTKITLPSSAHLGLLGWNEQTRDVYPTRISLMKEITRYLAAEAKALAKAGYKNIQVDSPTYHNFFDPELLDLWRKRGVNMEELLPVAIECDNQVLAAAKDGNPEVITSVHMCLGNGATEEEDFRLAEGSYDAIAQRVFPRLQADRLLLDFSSAIRGERGESRYAPLEFVRPESIAVLGLISSKRGKLEDPNVLRAELNAAARHLQNGLEQVALSPQCGFASAFTGNPLTMQEQWDKLELVTMVARQMFN